MRTDVESTAPNLDEIRGGLGCFRSLLRDLEHSDLVHGLVDRFGYIGDCAHRRIEIGRILREVQAPVRARLLADCISLAEVALAIPAGERSTETFWNREALDDALESLAQNYARDRFEFKQVLEFELGKLLPGDAGRLRRIVRDLANGLVNTGIEQGETMRSARSEVLDLVSDTAGDRTGIGWLLLGWLCLWNSAFCADAVSHFSQGITVVGDGRGYLAHLLHRFLGMALEAGGRHAEALESARAALEIRATADLYLEASRYAMQCGRGGEAKHFFETAVRQEPMYVFVALADPDMAPLELVMVAEYASAGTQMRQTALRAIDGWEAMKSRVKAAEATLGESIEIPFELSEGLEDIRAIALKSDILEAIGVRSAAKRGTLEVYQFVHRKISTAVGQRDAEAVAARQNATDTLNKREGVHHSAEAQAEAIIAQAEAELRQLLGGERASGALGNGLGGSFLMLLAYVVVAGFMGPRGVQTGLDSPFGMVAACLIAAPAVLGFGASAAGGLKQASLSAEIERRASYAREKAKQTLIEVEKNFARQAEASKAAATACEERARKASEALSVLRQNPDASSGSPTASKAAA